MQHCYLPGLFGPPIQDGSPKGDPLIKPKGHPPLQRRRVKKEQRDQLNLGDKNEKTGRKCGSKDLPGWCPSAGAGVKWKGDTTYMCSPEKPALSCHVQAEIEHYLCHTFSFVELYILYPSDEHKMCIQVTGSEEIHPKVLK